MAAPPDASTALAVRAKVQNFLEAAQTGNINLLKRIAKELDEGKGIAKSIEGIKDANNRTALHFAAREGKTEICQLLVGELKLDVDPKDDDGETPLIHATRQGHFGTVKYLLDQGANPSASSNLGATALHHAAGIGNMEIMELLISKGAEIESQSDAGTPLVWAAGHGQPDSVKLLLKHNANPNIETDDGITPLLSAVAAGSLQCLQILIEAGANVNIKAGGATPLHVAADIGNLDVIKCLLNAGADPNISDEDGFKPVQVAALRENREAVEILFPATSQIQEIPDWSVEGLIKHTVNEFNKANKTEAELPKSSNNVKIREIIEVGPEEKKRSAEAKQRGDEAFKRKDFQTAVDAYTQAIDLDPNEAVLYSNRSLSWLRLGQGSQALEDAKMCKELKPDWHKAHYREGAALRLLLKFDEAANAFYEGVRLEPENKELVDAFREAVEAGRKFHGANQQKS